MILPVIHLQVEIMLSTQKSGAPKCTYNQQANECHSHFIIYKEIVNTFNLKQCYWVERMPVSENARVEFLTLFINYVALHKSLSLYESVYFFIKWQ